MTTLYDQGDLPYDQDNPPRYTKWERIESALSEILEPVQALELAEMLRTAPQLVMQGVAVARASQKILPTICCERGPHFCPICHRAISHTHWFEQGACSECWERYR